MHTLAVDRGTLAHYCIYIQYLDHPTMHFLITPRRAQGRVLAVQPVKRTASIRGDLTISTQICEHLNRHSQVARLQELYGTRRLLLPVLYDATVSAMATEGFTLSGIELDDGRWFAQSWWCRPIHQ